MSVPIDKHCKQLLRARVHELWPGLEITINCVPLLNLQLGDLASDCCFRIAQATKLDPLTVGGQIIDGLSLPRLSGCEVVEGYINFRVQDTELWPIPPLKWECADESHARPIVVVCPARFPDLTPHAHLRVAMRGLLQALLAHRRQRAVSLVVGNVIFDLKAQPFHSVCEVLCRIAFAEKVSSREAAHSLMETALLRHRGENILALMPSDFFPLPQMRRILDACPPTTRLRFIGREWAYKCDRGISLDALSRWDNAKYSALLFILAGALPGEDLDWAVPALHERANVPWFLTSLVERYRRFLAHGVKRAEQNQAASKLGIESRPLLHRVVTLPLFEREAAENGDVEEFVSALEDLLSRAAHFLNRPHGCDEMVRDISTGTLDLLSAIISRYTWI